MSPLSHHRPTTFSTLAAGLLLAALLVPAPSRALILTDDGDDFILLYSSGYYLSVLPGQGITSFAAPNLGAIAPGEPLYIITHGEEGSIHGMTAQQLVDFLGANGLPKSVEDFYLFSCEAGLGNPSLVEQTGPLLVANGWARSTVMGARGCAVTNRAYFPAEISEDVVRPDKFPQMYQLQLQLEQQYQPQAALDQALQQWSQAHGGALPDLEQRAKLAAADATVRQFFDALLAQADHDGYLYPRGWGFQIWTYLNAGVPLSGEAAGRNLCIDFGDAPHDPAQVCYPIRWFPTITPVQYLQQATALLPPLTYRCASQDGRPCAHSYGDCQVYSIDGVENRGDSLWLWEIDGSPGALSACIYGVPSRFSRITWRYMEVQP